MILIVLIQIKFHIIYVRELTHLLKLEDLRKIGSKL